MCAKFSFARSKDDEENGFLEPRGCLTGLATGVFGVIAKVVATGLAQSVCIVIRLLRAAFGGFFEASFGVSFESSFGVLFEASSGVFVGASLEAFVGAFGAFGDAEGENNGIDNKGDRMGDCIGERGGEGKKANVLFAQSDDDDDDVELVLERTAGDNIIGGALPLVIGGRNPSVGDTKPIGGALPSEIDGRIIFISLGGLDLTCRRVCQRVNVI